MRDWNAIVRAHLGPLPLDPAREADVIDELAQHVAQAHADLVAAGVADDEALQRALQPLSSHQRLAIDIARADRPRPAAPPPPPAAGGFVTGLIRDLQYGTRLLLRAPGFSLVVILTLAIGAGATTAIFSVVNAVLLRPLPYKEPARLVMVGDAGTNGAGNTGYATFVDWRDRSHGFEELALIRSWSPTLTTGSDPERVAGLRVSWNYFRLLGVAPATGRDFSATDDTPARWQVVLLGDHFWRTRFNADPAVVGKVITMNDLPFEIVGVLPASFEPLLSEHFYQRADMWAPLGYDNTLPQSCRSCRHLKTVGRVKAGTTLEAARADLDAVQTQLRRDHPDDYAQETMAVVPLQDELTGRVRPALTVLAGAVVFVLLIGCANVANLLLARLAKRERELALRSALGAGRWRLVRQLLAESAVLSLAGGVLGVALAAWGVPLLATLTPDMISRLGDARVDRQVLLFSLGLSVLTPLLFGLLPALRSTRVNAGASLGADPRRTAHAPTSLARRMLILVDIALAVVLLAGAGLMIKSVGRLLDVDPGFKPDHVLTMQVSFVGAAYAKTETTVAKGAEMLAALRALPGVESAATAGQIPLGGNGDRWGLTIQGRAADRGADQPSVERYSVTPDYFAVMGIPLKRGRLFSEADRATTEPVILLGEETARALWPGTDPIGAHVLIGGGPGAPWRTVIGIVGNVRHHELAAPPTMEMYLPQAQLTDSFLTVVMRTSGDPALLADTARRTIRSVVPNVPVNQVARLEDLVASPPDLDGS